MKRTVKIVLNDKEREYLADKIFSDMLRAKFDYDLPKRRSKKLRLQLKENLDFLEDLFLKIAVE